MHEDIEIQESIQPAPKQIQIYHSGFVQEFPAVYIESGFEKLKNLILRHSTRTEFVSLNKGHHSQLNLMPFVSGA